VLSAEPLAGVCVISAFLERRRWGSKERAQRNAVDVAHQVKRNSPTKRKESGMAKARAHT
jgi:hypothetical protein